MPKITNLASQAGQLDVIQRIAAGQSQTSIAEEYDVDQSTICKFVARDEIRKKVEVERDRLVATLPDAVENIRKIIMNMLDSTDIRGKELAYKASKDLLKGLGLYLNPAMMVNVYNDNRKKMTVIHPDVLQILQNHSITGEKLID